MKAVIIAGGKGTRLQPLTAQRPKAMAPLAEKPVMQYGIELLKKHGITEIAVTVGYMAEKIEAYFGDGSGLGVSLTYFKESNPLGTAGSVKEAEAFLDEPFLVMSGDVLSDFHLREGIAAHERMGGLATIFVKEVESPLDFAVVQMNDAGQITRFLEKPKEEEIFGQTVSSGIYLMEPEILASIEKGEKADFGRDIFPRLLRLGKQLNGYPAEGYWADIGTLPRYYQAQLDLLHGHVSAEISGTEVAPGIWVGEDVMIEAGVSLKAPVVIGSGTVVQRGASIGPGAVVGAASTVAGRASVEGTVAWPRAVLQQGSTLKGAVLADGVIVKERMTIQEPLVIASGTVVEEVVLSSPRAAAAGQRIGQPVEWGPALKGHRARLSAAFANAEEQTAALASAYGSLLRHGQVVYLSSDHQPRSIVLKKIALRCLRATGVNVVEIESTLLPVFRFSLERNEPAGGLYIRQSERNGKKKLIIELFDERGMPINKEWQQRLQQYLAMRCRRFVPDGQSGMHRTRSDQESSYLSELLARIDVAAIRQRKWKIALYDETQGQFPVISFLFDYLQCEWMEVRDLQDIEQMESFVRNQQADLGILIGESGEFVSWMTEEGFLLSDEEQLLQAAQVQLALKQNPKLAAPLFGGAQLEMLAARFGGTIVRTKPSTRAMMEAEGTVQVMAYDAPFAILSTLYYLSTSGYSLTDLTETLQAELVYPPTVGKSVM
ncbi:sugar phosphate nucleotidyltransferase [Alkalihalobacillus oceani]|uniref:Sugar phosphate nucleotidyltransferase n=1 Tax=Halalkalibacter oceani TaxID=1653776 RepID=A0A9X2DLR1_9BACI|nr:sugar phosphate nucleotidyltransferase [Halalkalibacter oceani]MCM3712889.1 sugar phosphate nucleotidyltransferase [Halalkalibacter oceani]